MAKRIVGLGCRKEQKKQAKKPLPKGLMSWAKAVADEKSKIINKIIEDELFK